MISTENAGEFSSVAKGETLEDTVQILNGYADVIVIRHYEVGAAKRAATISKAPIINAGDGAGQHPTQALLDLYTIRKEIGSIDGLKIAMVGDLAQGRTVRSLTYLLSKYQDIKIYFVAPTLLKMKDDILEHLRERNIWYTEETDLDKVLPEVDVVYQTRIQKERFGDRIADYEKCRGVYIIDRHTLGLMKEKSIIMHPRFPGWAKSAWRLTAIPAPPTSARPRTACTCAWRCSQRCSHRRKGPAMPAPQRAMAILAMLERGQDARGTNPIPSTNSPYI